MTLTLTRHADVTAVLADRRFDVLAAPPAPRGLAWLRGAVARFSRGTAHAHRRDLATQALVDATPAELRATAAARARDPATAPRDVPVAVLAEALGARRSVRDAIEVVTPGYFGGVQSGHSEVDAAVDRLVEALGGERTELTAAKIGLLVQTHDATGGLVTNALAAVERSRPTQPIAAVLAETLRHDPPVPIMRRACLVDHDRPGHGPVPAGTLVILDLVRANRDPEVFDDPDQFDAGRSHLELVLTFGFGPRSCPGRDHALALAAGTVEGALGRG